MSTLSDPDGPFARDLAALRANCMRLHPPPPEVKPKPIPRLVQYNTKVAEARALGVRGVKERNTIEPRQFDRLIADLERLMAARRAKLAR